MKTLIFIYMQRLKKRLLLFFFYLSHLVSYPSHPVKIFTSLEFLQDGKDRKQDGKDENNKKDPKVAQLLSFFIFPILFLILPIL